MPPNTGYDLETLLNFGKPTAPQLPFSPTATATGTQVQNPLDTGFSLAKILDLGNGKDGFDSLKLFGNAGKALSGAGALFGAYNGFKQNELAEDAFDFQKDAFNQNTANQAKLVNSQLEDRQRSRISSTGNNNASGAYESLATYLDKNRVTAQPL